MEKINEIFKAPISVSYGKVNCIFFALFISYFFFKLKKKLKSN